MVLIGRIGRVSFLRVNAVGSLYGPPDDVIDVEVVIRLDTSPNEAFGFQLRNNNEGPTRQAMLELLRDAFNSNRSVHIEAFLDQGKSNGIIHRVYVTNP